jgi:hypothetical protein
MTDLTWNKVVGTNDLQCNEHPIRLVRGAVSSMWQVKVPYRHEPPGVWTWTAARTLPNGAVGGQRLEAFELEDSKAQVAEWLDNILTQIPDDYGAPMFTVSGAAPKTVEIVPWPATDLAAELRDVIIELNRAIAQVHTDAAASPFPITAVEMKDASGRYMLGDLAAAKANALTALANLHRGGGA